jgi:2-hydroxy-3-keto-5-methylthiopentenyl-1-phosphate phosphatase
MNNSSSDRIAFVLDFDGTITTKDTISTLAGFGISFQRKAGNDFDEEWKKVLRSYGEDYSKHIQNYRPAKNERQTLEEEIEYYRSLREVELKSFERVSTSGLFKGVENNDWEEFGHEVIQDERVEIRKGFEDFVASILSRDSIWGVVSVNFSSHFIRGVLRASLGDENTKVDVVANSITSEGSIVGPEVEESGSRTILATSDTKLSANKWSKPLQHRKQNLERWVYVGDSGTDIECLTAENVVGIIMSDDGQSDLIKTFERVGKTVVHVENLQEGSQQLYWARNFDEIVGSALFSSLFSVDE